MRRSGSTSARPAAVGIILRAERSSSGMPSATSRSARWRDNVGWLTPSVRAAPVSEPASTTASVKLQYFLHGDGAGAFVGAGFGRVRRTVRDAAGIAPELRTWHNDVGVEGGYRFQLGEHFYATPWAGLGWVSHHEDRFIGGKRYRQKPVMPFAAVHIGYRF